MLLEHHWNLKGSEHNTPEMMQDFARKHGFPCFAPIDESIHFRCFFTANQAVNKMGIHRTRGGYSAGDEAPAFPYQVIQSLLHGPSPEENRFYSFRERQQSLSDDIDRPHRLAQQSREFLKHRTGTISGIEHLATNFAPA